jgi:hypothetical protein
LDITDTSMPVSVLVKRIPDTVELQGFGVRVPRLERDTHTTIFKCVPC